MTHRALILLAATAACAPRPAEEPSGPEAAITVDGLMTHIRALSSDAFEGRAPGTAGEDSTVRYLAGAFQGLGLQPGNPDGGYLQAVDMVGFTATPTIEVTAGGVPVPLTFPDDIVVASRRTVPTVTVPSTDVVFVGYGVVAPEYAWDDYKDLDVRGKTVLMLINDPAVPDPANPSVLDSAMFRGEAMTYYGRWTYKYEIATAKGAAAALIIHETGPAGYPWEVVQGSWGRENFDVRRADQNIGRVAVEGWVTLDKAKAMLAASGQDFDALKAAAVRKDFRPVPLKATAAFTVRNTLRDIRSRNVIAKLEGSDPRISDQYIVYTAHWDHLGRDTTLTGDQVWNGASDNASGTAALLEVAKAFTAMPTPPKRSILFLAVTAEEQGLAGAKYYAQNPLYPLEQTLANINIDVINQWGRTRDLVVVGLGNSTLDETLASVAPDRVLVADPQPEKGFFYRSDHFEFAKRGVPALYVNAGMDFLDKPAGYGQQKRDEYEANDYHKPSDEIKPDWDLRGGVADARLLFRVGAALAEEPVWPQWKPGTEFKAVRDAALTRQMEARRP